LGVQLAQAVLAGNRVTVKPSELACETQGFLLDLAANAARDVGLPEELLRRTEATRDAGRDLLAGGGIDHVVFTGSTGVGRAIAEALAPRLVTSTLELSGRDSAFVLRDADLKLAAKTIWWAVTTNAGQTCMAPRRALVHTSVYQAFLRELGLFAGGAVRRSLVSESAAADVVRLAEEAAACGARSLSGVLEPRRGRAVVPVAMVDCPPDASLVEGDHFGPAIAVVPCDSEAAMLAIHNRCDQHLATSVFSKRPAAALDRLAPYLHVRTVTANNCIIPTAHPGVSIAGSGESGWGASQGRDGLLALTAGVNVSTTSPVFRPPLDAPHPSRVDGMARMFVRLLGGVRHRAKAPEVIRVGPAVGTAAGTAEDSGSQAASEAAPVATAGGQRRVETKIKHTSAETTQPAGASE
ncbi:MAG: aldehyde dehydrogenase family protein, partial [Planctomycetota bacterium]